MAPMPDALQNTIYVIVQQIKADVKHLNMRLDEMTSILSNRMTVMEAKIDQIDKKLNLLFERHQ